MAQSVRKTTFKPMDYNAYLHTPHWYAVRARVWAYHPHRCWICKSIKDLVAHHLSYENLGKENVRRDIVILCGVCHDRVHFTMFGKKTLLKRKELVHRMRLLKLNYCIQHLDIIASLKYLLLCILF